MTTVAQIAPPNLTPVGGLPDLPPASAQVPGFVPPPAPATPPVAAPAAAPAPATGEDFTAAIAALTAALKANGQEVPAEAAPAAAPQSLNNLQIDKLEDPVLRSMATVMKTVGAGLDMDRVFGKAIEHGDAGLLDVAYLREKGGTNAEQLITIAQGIIQTLEAQTAKVTQDIYAFAQGKDNWDACTTAFNTKAPEALRQVCAAMLNSGNNSQITAAAKLVVEFARSNGFVSNAQPLVATGASVPNAQGLSKDEFQTELRKLNPQDRNFDAQRNELFARRQLGKRVGK